MTRIEPSEARAWLHGFDDGWDAAKYGEMPSVHEATDAYDEGFKAGVDKFSLELLEDLSPSQPAHVGPALDAIEAKLGEMMKLDESPWLVPL